jgi:hypothetical protein
MTTLHVAPADPHWRARLAEVQDLLLVAHDVDDVVNLLLKLTVVLTDEWTRIDDRDLPILRQLVREAYELLKDPESHLNVRDWLKAAEPFARRES